MSAVLPIDRVGGRDVIDFDHFSAHFRDHWRAMAVAFHATGRPIAWTERYGGSWVVGDWEAAQRISREWETFTSFNDLDGTGNGGKGQAVPQMSYPLLLGESDPPLHTQRRRLEVPFFTPKAMRRWRPVVERFLAEALNGVVERGSADLIADVIVPTTARTTLHILGYPGDWQGPAEVASKAVYLAPTDPGYPAATQARMRESFREMLTERAARPTGDIISALATGVVDDRPLSLDEGESMMNALVFGGFDTTVSATGSAMIWFDEHREERAQACADPKLLLNAVDELLRYFPPVAHQARTAVRDTEVLGQPIAAGERMLLWLGAVNHDPRHFEDPEVVDLRRRNARDHVSFSAGHHRCLGSPLAKLEIQHMLETIYATLPDIEIDHAGVERYPTSGAIAGYVRIPATFSPRARIDVPELQD